MNKRNKLLAGIVLLVFLAASVRTGASGAKGTLTKAIRFELGRVMKEKLYETYCPCLSLAEEKRYQGSTFLQGQVDTVFPLYAYATADMEAGWEGELSYGAPEPGQENPGQNKELSQQKDGGNGGQSAHGDTERQTDGEEEPDLQELLQEENEAAMNARNWETGFVPHERQARVELKALEDYDTLLSTFYTVDANTMIGSNQLDISAFLERDMRVDKNVPGPQILIFHTHSREAFADSAPGEEGDTIVGVGEHLAEILRRDYGYTVLHHTEAFDAGGRDDAYSRALPGVEQILEENPSIQVVIDLHRDEMPDGKKLVTELDGRPTARFMFFNGLSRTRKTGNISYLYNENLEANLAFSFRMQLKAAEYYPGLTRKIYLKGYRYNMHLKDKYLLIELGAQNNTLEEVMNACDPLAHILDLVLSEEPSSTGQ